MSGEIIGIADHNVGALLNTGHTGTINTRKYNQRAVEHFPDGATTNILLTDGLPSFATQNLQYSLALLQTRRMFQYDGRSLRDLDGYPYELRDEVSTVYGVPYYPDTDFSLRYTAALDQLGLSSYSDGIIGLPPQVAEFMNNKGNFHGFVESVDSKLNIPGSRVFTGQNLPGELADLLGEIDSLNIEARRRSIQTDNAKVVLRICDSNGGAGLYFVEKLNGQGYQVSFDGPVDKRGNPDATGERIRVVEKLSDLTWLPDAQYIAGRKLDAVDSRGVSFLHENGSTRVLLPNGQHLGMNGECIGTYSLHRYHPDYANARDIAQYVSPFIYSYMSAAGMDPFSMALANVDTITLSSREERLYNQFKNNPSYGHLVTPSRIVLAESNPRFTNLTLQYMFLAAYYNVGIGTIADWIETGSLVVNGYDSFPIEVKTGSSDQFYNDMLAAHYKLRQQYGDDYGFRVRMVGGDIRKGETKVGISFWGNYARANEVLPFIGNQLEQMGGVLLDPRNEYKFR